MSAHRRGLLISAILALSAWTPLLPAGTNEDCLVCHTDTSQGALHASAHAELSCRDCHTGLNPEEIPHAQRIVAVDCMSCHGDARETHPFHSRMAEATGSGGPPGAACRKCHGTHDVTAVADPGFRFAIPRLTRACGECHKEVASHFERSSHGKAMAASLVGAPTCLSCHEQPITVARATGNDADLKIAQEKICLSCHLDNPDVRARMAPQAGFIAAYEKSVHGAALLKGNAGAASCIDCHGSHEMKKGMDPESRVSKNHIPETCSACHGDIAAAYGGSAHAEAIARGNLDAPVCTDCHGEHNIMLHTDPSAPVAAANVSAQVCSPCHSSVKLSQKYGIASDRFQTFADSYHGLALRGGAVEVANCASCHGAHDIRRSGDPASSVNKANLATTCGQCHPGANERFAVGSVHLAITEAEEPILYWIATIYVIVIVLVVGGMLVHNILDFIRKAIRRFGIRRGVIEPPVTTHRQYLRMTLNERIQHALLLVSFMVLVVTGFMLSYPDAWWVAGIRRLSGGIFELRSLLHRIAAVVTLVASVWHLGYITFTARGRRLVADLLPRWSDVVEAFGAIRYTLGLSRSKPLMGRFSYIEKSEYWALVWGNIVMALTGVILWFENASIGVLTKLGWDIARTVHFYEAWLAALAILVWHIYFVVFNPDVYPMNMAWLTGKLTEEEMAEEHPRHLAEIRQKEADAEIRRNTG